MTRDKSDHTLPESSTWAMDTLLVALGCRTTPGMAEDLYQRRQDKDIELRSIRFVGKIPPSVQGVKPMLQRNPESLYKLAATVDQLLQGTFVELPCAQK
jgi:hypothetical protein